jgi:hypothetical protein
MISAIIPYVLTIIGIVIDDAHNFPAMATLLTVVGVIWTVIRSLAKRYDKKGMLLAVGGHGLIWLLLRVFPNFGAKVIGTSIGILVSILIVAFVWAYFSGSISTGKSTKASNRLPDIIYDSNNEQWICSMRYKDGTYDYRSQDGSRSIRIYHAEISGTGANTSEGYFHWY